MKNKLIMTAIIIINFIFQTSLYNFKEIFGVRPNISLILLVVFSIMTDEVTGGILGIITGILYDTMIYDLFGVYTLIYFVIGVLIGSLSDDMNRENYLLYSTITFISSIMMFIFKYIILFFLKYRVENVYGIMGKMAIEVILNTLLTGIVLKFIIYLFSKFNFK